MSLVEKEPPVAMNELEMLERQPLERRPALVGRTLGARRLAQGINRPCR